MAVDGDRVIAAVDHAAEERFAQAFGNMAATNGAVESAGVAVEIFETPGHADENMEVVGIEEPTFTGAMGGDGGDDAFEGQGKDARIGVISADDGQCVFAASVSKEGQFAYGHAFPEF